jgi:ATP-dependent Lon protease
MYNSLPVMLLKGLVLLPNQEVKLDINNTISKKIVMMASKNTNDELMIVCPKDQKEEVPEVTDLPFIGVVCKITSKIELSNGHLKIKVKGLKRVAIEEYSNNIKDNDILECSYKDIELPKFEEVEELAARRKILDVLKKYIDLNPAVSNSIFTNLKDEYDLNKITDQITLFLPLNIEKKIEYMEEINALKRTHKLIKDLNIEIEVSLLDEQIEQNLELDLEETQKEFILREKIKEIKKELGEEDYKNIEVEEYQELLNNLNLPLKTRNKINYEIKKYELTNEMSPDYSIIRTYLDWILNLPWQNETTDTNDIEKIRASLDKSHYGLDEIKDRIIEYVVAKNRNKEMVSPIICLVGPPGVGKTTLASSIAASLNKEFAKISVGGLNDSNELVGHRRTYIGASPGKIIQSIKKCGSKNPVILIDEVDKMVKDYKGDPASVLLDILDVEQNKNFIDNYIEEAFDLSKVMFILTANDENNIPVELLDRLEIIKLSSYTELEKIDIAKKYLLPKIYNKYLLKSKEVKVSNEVIKEIIEKYTKEAGVRELTRTLEKIIRKIITENYKNEEELKIALKPIDLKKYLGNEKYDNVLINKIPVAGRINGLAYTPYGGVVMPIECAMYEGSGKVKITGSLGDTIKESVDVVISYIQANKDNLKINDYYFKTKDLHIHMLDGATKKNGPSAGIAITTAIIGLILNKPVSTNIAFTGEMSLTGDVLPIGGLKEKIIGAYNSNVDIIFIPKKNHNDLDEIPNEVLKNMTIIEVNNYIEVYNNIFG